MNDKVVETQQNNKGTPIDQAVNKMREAKLKEVQNKIDSQTKVAFDAKIVADREFDKLKELVEELEFEKARVSDFAKSTK